MFHLLCFDQSQIYVLCRSMFIHLGIVMWELLTGDEPYSDMRAAEIIGNVQSSL
jgi:hypothetical protein